MSYMINAGIAISLDNTNWYYITDHNREQIDISNELIEHAQRMANGRMRKYVIALKRTFTTAWKDLPSKTATTTDGNYSSAWLQQFYDANAFVPVYIKFTHATINSVSTGSLPSDSTYQTAKTGTEIIKVFMTKLGIKTTKRNQNIDYVDMDVEFTEV